MKRKFTINGGVFKGATYQKYNGSIVTETLDKENVHVTGRSGNTKAYDTADGARLFLSDDQVTDK